MQKDQSYHEAAIKYNDSLSVHAAGLADEIEHEEIKRWCRAVEKQHRFHSNRHAQALKKLLDREATGDESPTAETPDPTTDYRSAATGQFVTEEFAHDNPDTTVGETTTALISGGEIEVVDDAPAPAAVVTEDIHNHPALGGIHPGCPACGTMNNTEEA
jgi:hypothetical protein